MYDRSAMAQLVMTVLCTTRKLFASQFLAPIVWPPHEAIHGLKKSATPPTPDKDMALVKYLLLLWNYDKKAY